MRILSSKFRVAIGQAGLIISLVMAAFYLDIVPDRDSAVRQGHASLAEAIAVTSSMMVTRKDIPVRRLKDYIGLMVERNEDLLSGALRRTDGHTLVAIGNHEKLWQPMPGEYSTDTQIRVPIHTGEQKWGQLELRFASLSSAGIMGIMENPMVRLVLFLGAGGLIVFYFYLGRVLRHLNPSQAIPGRVRAALDTMAEGLLVLDRKEHIVLANQAFATMIGKSPDELMGYHTGDMPWMDDSGDRVKKPQRPWVQALGRGEAQTDRMLRLSMPDKSWRTFNVNCSPVLGAGGKYAGVLVSFNDITQLEEKEIELRKSRDAAEAANEAKSSFLANMSHEIRTPMNAILGFTEILKRGYVRNEEESLKYLNTIHSSGKNLLELINDILDLSKIESGRLEVEKTWTEPYRIIHEVFQTLDVKAQEKGITLGFSARSTLPEIIETDPARLRQITFNLVGNAIKFTEQGGVMVTCRFESTAGEPRLIIAITDTGIGMPEDRLESIFDPFVQADNSVTRRFGGTGLGLSISRNFARALGGDISVESTPGKGSTFNVVLAIGDMEGVSFLKPEDIAIVIQPETGEMKAVRWQFPESRVLVVDDAAENRELVRLLLEDSGLKVDKAENGRVGVEKAQANHYELILMDVQMPVMDGFTATQKLRQHGLKTPIIALTANAMKGFDQQCLAIGYSGYLTKPIDVDEFMEMVADILGGQIVRIVTSPSDTPDSEKEGIVEVIQENESIPIVSQLPADFVPLAPSVSSVQKPVVSRLASHPRLRKVILEFVGKLEGQVEKMEQELERGDMAELAGLAHWLKGSGGTVGYDDFTGPAAKLEDYAKSGMAEQAGEMLEQVKCLVKSIVPPAMEDSTDEEQQLGGE